MMGSVWLVLLAIGLVQFQTCSAELKLVLAVYRHGNRNPDPQPYYTKDPYINKNYEPEGIGNLTNVGKLTGYQLGKFIRKRYLYFLGPIYSPSIVQFTADNHDRSMMAAEVTAAAMYPPVKSQKFLPTLDWQPIPVWTVPRNQSVLYNGMFCNNHRAIRAKLESSDPALVKYERNNKDLYAFLAKNVGSSILGSRKYFFRQHLVAQRDVGLKLPPWTHKVFPGALDRLALFDLKVQSYNIALKQLMGGVWIREWLGKVDDYVNNKASLKRKAFIYAGHGLNIAGTLLALKSFDNNDPAYNSIIFFELHELKGQLYVKVLHRNTTHLRVLKIPGCNVELCPLKVFRRIVAPLIAKDPMKACGGITFGV